MKKLLTIVALLVIGIVGLAKADPMSFYTTQSTTVLVSSATGMELLSMTVSTGSGTNYVLLIDSNPLFAAKREESFVSDFPKDMWMCPPINIASTTANASFYNDLNSQPIAQNYDFSDGAGNGTAVKKGLVIFQSGVGGTITIRYRKTR